MGLREIVPMLYAGLSVKFDTQLAVQLRRRNT